MGIKDEGDGARRSLAMNPRGVYKYLAGMGMGVQVGGTLWDSWRKSRPPGQGYGGRGQGSLAGTDRRVGDGGREAACPWML